MSNLRDMELSSWSHLTAGKIMLRTYLRGNLCLISRGFWDWHRTTHKDKNCQSTGLRFVPAPIPCLLDPLTATILLEISLLAPRSPQIMEMSVMSTEARSVSQNWQLREEFWACCDNGLTAQTTLTKQSDPLSESGLAIVQIIRHISTCGRTQVPWKYWT